MEENNVKPWVVWLFAIISILIIGPLCFWLGRQFSNKEDNKKDEQEVSWVEKNEVISLASDYDHLYLLENNKNVKIANINRDDGLYFYDQEKVYVIQYSYDNKSSEVGYYDLLKNNEYHKVFSPDLSLSPESIIVLENHIYLTFNQSKDILDYDMDSKETKKLTYFDDYFEKASYGSFLLFRTFNNKVFYWTRGTSDVDAELGEINLKNGEKKLIASNVYLEYVYGDKLIYRQYSTEDNNSYGQYFEYDTSKNKSVEISDKKIDLGGSVSYSLIVPYKNYYVYAYEGYIYEYQDGKEKEIAHLDDLYIGTITLISNDTVLITNDSDMCLMGECDLISYRFNLDSYELKEDKDNERLYAYVHYVK